MASRGYGITQQDMVRYVQRILIENFDDEDRAAAAKSFSTRLCPAGRLEISLRVSAYREAKEVSC